MTSVFKNLSGPGKPLKEEAVRRSPGRLLVAQTGGADPAGAVPVELGPDFVRLGPWTGEEPLPLPLEVGGRGPAEDERPGWVVEALEEVEVPAGRFQAFRCAPAHLAQRVRAVDSPPASAS